jgi:hypothetical protein
MKTMAAVEAPLSKEFASDPVLVNTDRLDEEDNSSLNSDEKLLVSSSTR